MRGQFNHRASLWKNLVNFGRLVWRQLIIALKDLFLMKELFLRVKSLRAPCRHEVGTWLSTNTGFQSAFLKEVTLKRVTLKPDCFHLRLGARWFTSLDRPTWALSPSESKRIHLDFGPRWLIRCFVVKLLRRISWALLAHITRLLVGRVLMRKRLIPLNNNYLVIIVRSCCQELLQIMIETVNRIRLEWFVYFDPTVDDCSRLYSGVLWLWILFMLNCRRLRLL